jgi:acylpyruvate hydrolase
MKLVSYLCNGNPALGAMIDRRVVDVHRAYQAALRMDDDWDELAVARLRVPPDMVGLLHGGQASMEAARRAVRFIEEQEGAEREGELWHSLSDVTMLAPIQRPGKVVCVGLNYRSHLEEIREPTPVYPILFHKAATSVIGPGEAIVLPRISQQVDYEGELAVVIGRRGKYIPEKDALSYVAGYTCANDVSAHDLEFRTSQWTSGKMLDTFCPLGPVLRTRDEITDPNALSLRTMLNGRTVQEARTSEMVFTVPVLLSYISSLATLEPGDVILTGTPAGIGCNRTPQVFLKGGDEISVEIDGIGVLTNPVIAEGGC